MTEVFIGALSGTSMDAIDIAIVQDDFELLHTYSHKYNNDLKNLCSELVNSKLCDLQEVGNLNYKLGLEFAEAINICLKQANLSKSKVTAIGLHGQTIKHNPDLNFTLQLADPNVVNLKTGIPVVTDFRGKDIAAGGQGAPLAPILHKELFLKKDNNIAVVNIGGISNITLLPEGVGYDTGPGNCLLDAWCNEYFDCEYDAGGEIAAKGTVLNSLLQLLLEDSYLKLCHPKSTGRDYFNLEWLENTCDLGELNKVDVLTTLTRFTAITIVQAIQLHFKEYELYVCGGGVANKYLMKTLQKLSATNKVMSTDVLGLDPKWLEALLFALLAKKYWNKEPVSIGTGPMLLGCSYF